MVNSNDTNNDTIYDAKKGKISDSQNNFLSSTD